ncbi:hypothetical protein AKO1_002990 [Acrasis kona]|uniref:MYND-type domain-containing protein n=1 Tax=Acrasis kona TaxID=1008807 RepID=A0AAW2Z7Q7_9EUKA
MTRCDNCGRCDVDCQRCAQCLSRNYCGSECSLKDWNNSHKEECKLLGLKNPEAASRIKKNKIPVYNYMKKVGRVPNTSFLKEPLALYDDTTLEMLKGWDVEFEDYFDYSSITQNQVQQIESLLFDRKYYNQPEQIGAIFLLAHHKKFTFKVRFGAVQVIQILQMYMHPNTEAELCAALDELIRSELFDRGSIYTVCSKLIEEKSDFHTKKSIAGVLSRMCRVFPEDFKQIESILQTIFSTENVLMETPDTLGFFVCKLIEIKSKDSQELVRRAFSVNNVDVIYCGGYGSFCKKLNIPFDSSDELVVRYSKYDE